MGSDDYFPFRNPFRCNPLPGSKVAPCCSSHFFLCYEFMGSIMNSSVAFIKAMCKWGQENIVSDSVFSILVL